MPGIKEQHIKQNAGLRNWQFLLPRTTDDSRFYSEAADASTVVAGTVAVSAKGMSTPRTLTAKIIADGTVASRTFSIKAKGKNQFGEYVEDTITVAATASATVRAEGTKVFAEVTGAEVITATNLQAADDVMLGVGVTAAIEDLIIYGIPYRCSGLGDIKTAMRYDHSESSKVAFQHVESITWNSVENGISATATEFAFASNTDRFFILTGRTTYNGRTV